MGTGDGDDPRSPANRGWWWGWTPDPGPANRGCHSVSAVAGAPLGPGMGVDPRSPANLNRGGTPPPIPGKSGMGTGTRMGTGMGIGGSAPWNERELRSEHA